MSDPTRQERKKKKTHMHYESRRLRFVHLFDVCNARTQNAHKIPLPQIRVFRIFSLFSPTLRNKLMYHRSNRHLFQIALTAADELDRKKNCFNQTLLFPSVTFFGSLFDHLTRNSWPLGCSVQPSSTINPIVMPNAIFFPVTLPVATVWQFW